MPFKNAEDKKKYHKRYIKEWYQKNKQTHKRNITANKKRKQEWLREYKSGLSCSDCGASHPAIIDFHHISDKEFQISKWITTKNCSIEKLKQEIEKCVPLCKNCHAILHWEQRQNSGSIPVTPSRGSLTTE